MKYVEVQILFEAFTEDGTDLNLYIQPTKLNDDLFLDIYQKNDFCFLVSISELKELVRKAEIMQKALDDCEEKKEKLKKVE
jgi:hypothetical protein